MTWALPSPGACAGVALATRVAPERTPTRAFRSHARLWEALTRDELSLDDTVRLGARVTTVGRHLVAACLPPAFAPTVNEALWGARTIADALRRVTREVHAEAAARSAEAFEALGRFVIERSGLSLAAHDFEPPRARSEIRAQALERVERVTRDTWQEGLYTFVEHYNKTVDLWSEAAERERHAVRAERTARDPLTPFVASAVAPRNIESLRAMRGLVALRSGELSERPVLHNAGDGFDAHEAMLLWTALRGQALTQLERDEVAATLLDDLSAALSETKVVARDCGTRRGVRVGALAQRNGETIARLSTRIEGRVAAAAVVARDGRALAAEGALLDATLARAIEAEHVPWVLVRDVQACEARGGVCARCFGLDADDATWTAPGDDVGARAALSITEALRTITTRWVHIC